MEKRLQKGQALLVVVLVVVVALTIGLSVATRSITSVRITTEEKESQRAFSAAEAGIEKALQTGSGGTINIGSGTDQSTVVTTVGAVEGDAFPVANDNMIPQGESVDVWLVGHDGLVADYADKSFPASAGTKKMFVFWDSNVDPAEDNDKCKTAAVEVIVVAGAVNNPTTRRYAFDPCNNVEKRGGGIDNNFIKAKRAHTHGPITFDGKEYRYQFANDNVENPITSQPQDREIDITDGILVRITPLYKDARIGVSVGTGAFPAQGNRINSKGETGTTQRRIVVFQEYPKIPQEFFYVLYSAN